MHEQREVEKIETIKNQLKKILELQKTMTELKNWKTEHRASTTNLSKQKKELVN